MKKTFLTLSLVLLTIGAFLVSAQAKDLLDVRDSDSAPVKLIYDTDMGNDADDALALAIIHNMIERGKCDLLGITVTKSDIWAARYCKAFNMLYGRPDIPIGLVNEGVAKGPGKYLQRVLELKNEDGSAMFPCPMDWVPEDSVVLLRKLLAAAPDHSVVIAQVGFSTNLARLLDTPADDISPMTGKELAAKKVRLVSAMFGAFTFQNDQRFVKHREYNVVTDVKAAQKLTAEWPTPIVFSGFELGVDVKYRECSLFNDLTPAPNMLQKSLLFYHEGWGSNDQCTWDLTSVLFVLRPEEKRGYYSLSEAGKVTVRDDGTTFFTADPNGSHKCFISDHDQKIRVEEAFVNLCSEKH